MLGVASRFAVLKIEGEDGSLNSSKKKVEKPTDKKQIPTKPVAPKKKVPQATSSGQSNQKAGGVKKGKGNQNPKKKVVSDAQWEEWKRKDEEYVNTNYQDELQEALLQSKLDFEEKKDVYTRVKKENETDKKSAASGGKKKKAKVMSLEQFNNMHQNENGSISEDVESPSASNGKTEVDPEFFENIKEEAKKTYKQEEKKRIMLEREPFVNEMITIAQYKARLDERDQEIAALKEEVNLIKGQLSKVKSRNQMLCGILGQAEMKDKAQILVQVDELQRVRDELTVEMTSLHAQLEQERSKVRSLTTTDAKMKGKKRTASETTSNA